MGGAARQSILAMANRAVTASRKKEQSTKNGDNFKVAVRVRPLIERELKTGLPCVSPGVVGGAQTYSQMVGIFFSDPTYRPYVIMVI